MASTLVFCYLHDLTFGRRKAKTLPTVWSPSTNVSRPDRRQGTRANAYINRQQTGYTSPQDRFKTTSHGERSMPMDDPALARVFGGQAVPAAQPVPEDFRSLPRAEQRRRLVALIEGGAATRRSGACWA